MNAFRLKLITKLLCVFIFSLFFGQNVNAQFGKASKVKLPATYDFDYIYKLKMTNKKDDFNMSYYLSEDGEYFGFDASEMAKGKKQDGEMFMVMDSELSVSSMFMEMMGKKIVQKTKLKLGDIANKANQENEMKFEQIDSKTILGYECEGFIGEDSKSKVTFYVTDDAPVSFNNIWGANPKTMPKNMDASWIDKYAENGLMMMMIYEDKKKSKNNITMECIAVEEKEYTINTSEYGGMFSAFGN